MISIGGNLGSDVINGQCRACSQTREGVQIRSNGCSWEHLRECLSKDPVLCHDYKGKLLVDYHESILQRVRCRWRSRVVMRSYVVYDVLGSLANYEEGTPILRFEKRIGCHRLDMYRCMQKVVG